MKELTTTTRQRAGCGYLPPHPKAEPWQPVGGYGGPPAETCIGYTQKLPEVSEIGLARRHWDKGELRSYVAEQPTDVLMHGIAIFDGAIAEVVASQSKKDEA
jgi:hypothetical protein